MTDRQVLAQEVLASSFPTNRLSAGYRETEVDSALDELASRVRRGDDAQAVRGFVDSLRFVVGRGRRGYDVQAVDALLDHVVSALETDDPRGGDPRATEVPSGDAELRDATTEYPPTPEPPLPSAVVEHPAQGLFGRLFRRR